MGGERETELEKKKSKDKPDDETTIIQDGHTLRLHLKDGFVHFHDDKPVKLKCAVPVAIWWKEWERLRKVSPGNPQTFAHTDATQNTTVLVSLEMLPKTDGTGFFTKTTVTISPCEVDKNFVGLSSFTQGGVPR